MDNLTAVLIVEGAEEVQFEEEYFEAAQHLIDTGLAWSLQGFIGRACANLIEAGHCHPLEGESQWKTLKS